MEEYSYSNTDGDGVMVCSAWKPQSQQVSFTWKKPDGNVLAAVADEVSQVVEWLKKLDNIQTF